MVIGDQGAIGGQEVIGDHAAIDEEGPGLQIGTAESPWCLHTMPVGELSPQAHHT